MMWKTKVVVYTLVLNLALQPFATTVSQANDPKPKTNELTDLTKNYKDDSQTQTTETAPTLGDATDGTSTGTTAVTDQTKGKSNVNLRAIDTDKLLHGKDANSKLISPEEQLAVIADLGKIVAQNCLEIDGKAISARVDGHDLEFVDGNGKEISEKDAEKIQIAPAAITTDAGVIAFERPLNCAEANTMFTIAWENMLERERLSKLPKDAPVVAENDGKSTSDPNCDASGNCFRKELLDQVMPGGKESGKISKVAEDLNRELAGDKSGTEAIDRALSAEDQKQAACLASPNQARNTGLMFTKTIGCAADWTKSLFSPPAKGVGLTAWMANFTKKIANDAGGCLADVLGATIKSVWGLLKGVFYELPKAAWDLTKAGVRKVGSWMGLVKAESASSDKAHLASQTTKKEVDSYNKNWYDYVVGGLKSVVGFFLGEVTQELGCEKWAGLPYASACEKPWKGWECATCGQVQALFCGGAGAVIGSVLSAGIMGKVFRGVGGLGKGLFAKYPITGEARKVLANGASKLHGAEKTLLASSKGASKIRTPLSVRAGYKIRQILKPVKTAVFGKGGSGFSQKASRMLNDMKKSGVYTRLAKLGRGTVNAVAGIGRWTGKRAAWMEKSIVNPLEKYTIPRVLVIKPLKGAHSLLKDYFYTVNRAFEGRMIAPWNIRSARLADKAAREGIAKQMTVAGSAKVAADKIDEAIHAQEVLHLRKEAAMGGERAQQIAEQQMLAVGTEKYTMGVNPDLRNLDAYHLYRRETGKIAELEKEIAELKATRPNAKKTIEKKVNEAANRKRTIASYEENLERNVALAKQDALAEAQRIGSNRTADIEKHLESLGEKGGASGASASAEISTGNAAVDELHALRVANRQEAQRIEKLLEDAKASGNAKDIRAAESEMRQFIENMKEGYLGTTAKHALFRDSDNANRFMQAMRDQGFPTELVNLENGTFRVIHPKVVLDHFHSGLKNLGLGRAVKYAEGQGVINIQKPSEKVLRELGYGLETKVGKYDYAGNLKHYYDDLTREAENVGLRADVFKGDGGLTIRAKQGTLADYRRAEKALKSKLDENGFEFSQETGMVTPKDGSSVRYGTGYENSNEVRILVGEKDSQTIQRFRQRAKEQGMDVTEQNGVYTANMNKAVEECMGKK